MQIFQLNVLIFVFSEYIKSLHTSSHYLIQFEKCLASQKGHQLQNFPDKNIIIKLVWNLSAMHGSLTHTQTCWWTKPIYSISNKTIKFPSSQTMLKANKAALWSLLPDTANYQYSIFILSVRGNRGINFRPLCFPSSLSWSRVCLLTNLLSCFDHKCDYHHTRDNKTPYLCCTKEHELKPKL